MTDKKASHKEEGFSIDKVRILGIAKEQVQGHSQDKGEGLIKCESSNKRHNNISTFFKNKKRFLNYNNILWYF